MTHIVVWEFVVPAAHRAEFERAYGPAETGGAWASLFRMAEGYEGTELIRDGAYEGGREVGREGEAACRYLTIDRWESAAAYAAFKTQFAERYAKLDWLCRDLTTSERRIGAFEVL